MDELFMHMIVENIKDIMPIKYRLTFTGKERDSETGFSYFGARYYDSDLMTGWLSVDPMADKYPNISPYAYCGWNPVKLVDPDGEDIEIIGSGNQIYYWRYGKVYPTLRSVEPLNENRIGASVMETIKSLNDIYKTNEGKIVLDKLSEGRYTFSKETKTNVDACYMSNENTFYMNGHNDVGAISHEIFHAYQDANGRSGRSIYNEVEAYAFQGMITRKLNIKYFNPGLKKANVSRIYGEKYENAINGLISNFNVADFKTAIYNFKYGSKANEKGTYENDSLNPLNLNYDDSLLKKIR